MNFAHVVLAVLNTDFGGRPTDEGGPGRGSGGLLRPHRIVVADLLAVLPELDRNLHLTLSTRADLVSHVNGKELEGYLQRPGRRRVLRPLPGGPSRQSLVLSFARNDHWAQNDHGRDEVPAKETST